mmetsp:Transcript_4693/g.12637  ORF Transcript_4693/g.12637 Transcript_4693/m.12637 type:complete len:272 (+) Transcript_4693:658-1473(+)
MNPVLFANGRHNLFVQVRRLHRRGKRNTPAIFSPKYDVCRLFVEADAEPFQLVLDQAFMKRRLGGIKRDQNQIARARDRNHLPPATFTVLGAFDDSRQVEQLNFGAAVVDGAWDTSQRGELVVCGLTARSRQFRQQRRLADGWKSNESHARVSGLADLKTFTRFRTPSPTRRNQLAPKLGQLGLEQSQMPTGRLVLLRPSHLCLDFFDLLQNFRHRGPLYLQCRANTQTNEQRPHFALFSPAFSAPPPCFCSRADSNECRSRPVSLASPKV